MRFEEGWIEDCERRWRDKGCGSNLDSTRDKGEPQSVRLEMGLCDVSERVVQ